MDGTQNIRPLSEDTALLPNIYNDKGQMMGDYKEFKNETTDSQTSFPPLPQEIKDNLMRFRKEKGRKHMSKKLQDILAKSVRDKQQVKNKFNNDKNKEEIIIYKDRSQVSHQQQVLEHLNFLPFNVQEFSNTSHPPSQFTTMTNPEPFTRDPITQIVQQPKCSQANSMAHFVPVPQFDMS